MRCDPYLDLELGALRRTLSRTRAATNRVLWKGAMQERSSSIARLLRVLPKFIVAPGVRRTKGPEGWLITAAGIGGVSQVVLKVLTGTTGHTVAQLRMPIPIRVHRREMVDVARLEELQHDRRLTIEFAEALP